MRIIFLSLISVLSLFGITQKSSYDIKFDIVGTLGNVQMTFVKDHNSYYIRMDAKTVGFAKVLSNGREEIYESKGRIINGILIPKEYKKTKINNKYKKVKKFTFDHTNKKVFLENNNYSKSTNKSNNSKEPYKFYAKNDILSLYFNILELIKTSNKDKMFFNAIGGKKDNGRIDIEKLTGEKRDSALEYLDARNDLIVLKVTINQKIFSSEKGELLIAIDQKNMCTIAVLKDVILFGDIKGIKN